LISKVSVVRELQAKRRAIELMNPKIKIQIRNRFSAMTMDKDKVFSFNPQ
jgi:hypothetical protein